MEVYYYKIHLLLKPNHGTASYALFNLYAEMGILPNI